MKWKIYMHKHDKSKVAATTTTSQDYNLQSCLRLLPRQLLLHNEMRNVVNYELSLLTRSFAAKAVESWHRARLQSFSSSEFGTGAG